MIHPQYRADIDGLRAIAVLSVLGFHFFPEWTTGGFVGVDVFFVISGFLISGIIFGNLELNKFSYSEFYARRIRRIFPALILVLASSLIFGWIDLFPEEFARLAGKVFASAVFGANFAAMLQSSYFDPSQDFNPMLHIWSLGIEEQFYFAWPLLLTLVWRYKWNFLAVTLAIAAGSFVVNVSTVGGNPVAAFYSPIARFWELMVGGVLAYLTIHRPEYLPTKSDWRSIAGLALIGASIFCFDNHLSFPGWWALVPSLGTFLVISAGPAATLNRILLSNRWFVWVGLISYPLYLWHWPLLSFARYAASGSHLSWEQKLVLMALSVILAIVTYQVFEKKARSSSSTAIVPFLLGSMLVISVVSIGFYLDNGVPQRFENAEIVGSPATKSKTSVFVRKGDCFLDEADKKYATFCQSDSRSPTNLLVWGDSQAAALQPGLIMSARPGQGWALVGRPGCAPLLGANGSDGSDCGKLNQATIRAIANSSAIKTVVLVFATRTIKGQGHDFAGVEAGLFETARQISKANKAVILLVASPSIVQEDRYFNSFCFNRAIEIGSEPKSQFCSISRPAHENSVRDARLIANSLKEKIPEVVIVDPAEVLCDKAVCSVLKDGKSLYSFTDHLSDYGSALVGRLIYMHRPNPLE